MSVTIAEEWASYRAQVLPLEASGEQIKEAQKAYYCGALSAMVLVLGDGVPRSPNVLVSRAEAIVVEAIAMTRVMLVKSLEGLGESGGRG